MLLVFPALNRYVKARRRLAVLQALDAAGIPVQIWGDGWPDGLFQHHSVHPARPWDDMIRLIPRFRGLVDLSFMPDSADERLFTAAINGTAVCAMANPFLLSDFADGKNMVFYNSPEDLPARCAWLLENPDLAQQLAADAIPVTAAKHSWPVRAAYLQSFVEQGRNKYEEQRLRQAAPPPAAG